MEFSDKIFKAFLDEMNDLDKFRMSYALEHPSVSMDREDPDVKRLIEAIAFFSARTHVAGVENITAAQLRLFRQFFPFLLSPIPSMGLMQAKISGMLQERTFFPRGTELLVTTISGDAAIYRTMADLTVLPITFSDAKLIVIPGGYRLLFSFKAMYHRNDDIGRLSLNINYLNNYQTSLYLLELIKKSMRNCFVSFDEMVDENTTGAPCNLSFGSYQDADAQSKNEPTMHPIQASRFFFHFPSKDLFMHMDVPDIEKTWNQFTLCIDLDRKVWPSKLIINKDMFRPFTVPVENLVQAPAAPFVFDGTKEKFRIQHLEPDAGYELQHVTGVYKILDGVTYPLRPGILAGGEGSYEVEYRKTHGKINYYLDLHISQAFLKPVTIGVDAMWLQPRFSDNISQKLDVTPYRRHIAGIDWRIAGDLIPHHRNLFHENMDVFINLLSLKGKSSLTYNDVMCLLQVQGSVFQGQFKEMETLIKSVRVEQTKVQTAGGNSLKLIYHLGFGEYLPAMKPMINVFIKQVENILDSWISEAPVEATMEI